MSGVKLVWITHNADHLLCDWVRELIETDETGADLIKSYIEEFSDLEHLTLIHACFELTEAIPHQGYRFNMAWVNKRLICEASIAAWIEFTWHALQTTSSRVYPTAYEINKILGQKMPILWEALTRTLK
jgi:hypothetical protein